MTGRCLCEAVTYRIDADPVMTLICHCSDCQRQSGSSFSVNVVVPAEALHIEGGSLAVHETRAREGGAGRERKFCSSCGSPIATFMDDLPQFVVVKSGTLDDRSSLNPTHELHCDFIQPWVEAGAERNRFPGGLPTGG